MGLRLAEMSHFPRTQSELAFYDIWGKIKKGPTTRHNGYARDYHECLVRKFHFCYGKTFFFRDLDNRKFMNIHTVFRCANIRDYTHDLINAGVRSLVSL